MEKGKLRTHVRAIACISDSGVSGFQGLTKYDLHKQPKPVVLEWF